MDIVSILAIGFGLAFVLIVAHTILKSRHTPHTDDTYDEYGVNTKNSFNTPPKGE